MSLAWYHQITIPENVEDSFYGGTVHVSLKDKVFQPSSPVRHGAEFLRIVREDRSDLSDDGVNLHSMCTQMVAQTTEPHIDQFRWSGWPYFLPWI